MHTLVSRQANEYGNRPLYILAVCFNIPTLAPTQYMIPNLRALGFDTFQANLLTIPYLVVKSTSSMDPQSSQVCVAYCHV